MKKYFILAFLSFSVLSVSAQKESAVQLREQGMQLYAQKKYPEAYVKLQEYMNRASAEERAMESYTKAKETMYMAKSKIPGILSDLYDKGTNALKRGDYARADSLFATYQGFCVVASSKTSETYTNVTTQRALYLQRQGKLAEALQCLEEVAEIRRSVKDLEKANLAETLNLMASIHNQQGHYDKAIQLCTEALEIYKQRFGTSHEYYGTTMSNLGSFYVSRNAPGDRAYAVQLGEKALKCIPMGKPEFAQAMNNLVVYYSLSGETVKAEKLAKRSLRNSKKVGTETGNYAAILSNQAVRLANIGNYAQAVEFSRQAMDIFERSGETQSLNFARLLSNTASFEKHAEHYAEAIALWEKAAPIFEAIEGKSGSGYLNCMAEISAAHARTGNLEQATNINVQLQHTAEEGVRRGDARYAQSLRNRATIFIADGFYEQARKMLTQALSIYRQRGDKAEEAQTLNTLSSCYHHLGMTPQAIDTCQLAIAIYEQLPQPHDEEHALTLNNLSIFYYTKTLYADALRTGREAVALYEKTGRTETSFFASVLANVALYESSCDSLEQALAYSQRAADIQLRVLGEGHPDRVMVLFNQANYHLRLGQKETAQQVFHQALEMQMQQVRSNFSHLSTRGRELFWGTKSYVFRAAPYMATLLSDDEAALRDAYDALLFTKGLLLNSEVDFRKLLAQTASQSLQEQYAQLTAIHAQIENAWRTQEAQAKAQIPALQAEATRLERSLVRSCKEYGDFTKSMNITYAQVAKTLGENDVAIEFFDIDVKEQGRTYMALMARHGWSAPKLIRLFSESDFQGLLFNGKTLTQALADPDGINTIFSDTQVGQFVWGRLVPYMDGATQVFFAPSGIFYQWGIEYLKYDTRRVCDLYTMHRLSSTKLLAQQPGREGKARKAAVFGGLSYDATIAQLQAANQRYAAAQESYLASLDENDKQDLAQAQTRALDGFVREGRGSVSYLPGTLEEAQRVGESLMQRSIVTNLYLGEQGTEESFKALSGSGVSLIHIATHGFSLPEAVVRRKANVMSYLGASVDDASMADNSLCYSGLLMAGANNVLRGRKLPQGMENGVLTAREIAAMDLSDLDLVVLSACQTGLGELKEDGVFGLQRGFKKAGARSLLMSLWSVDDHATQIMMTNFYSALLAGQSRRQAFRAAQDAVRTSGFHQPFYWASFIMLDD